MSREVCAERQPSLAVPFEHIERAVVSRKPIVRSPENVERVARGLPPLLDREPGGASTVSFAYELMFVLSPTGASRFDAFATQHPSEIFDFGIGADRLNALRLDGPLEARTLLMRLLVNDRSLLERLLEPLGTRVTW